MKLWTLGYNENKKFERFPQVLFKGQEIDVTIETKLLRQIFKIFYLTHRDKTPIIKEIEGNVRHKLPYRDLLELITPNTSFEFEVECLVELLNIFQIEFNDEKNMI